MTVASVTIHRLACDGGCGLERMVIDRSSTVTVSISCEACYVERYGKPADGFVGFVDGIVRTVIRS